MDGLLLVCVFLLAYANGANDVSKGIATLVGSRSLTSRKALLWGSAWTLAGCLLAVFLGNAMLTTFGKGIVSAQAATASGFALAAACGAIAWVFLATRWGMPVSTTHAIVGALCGVGAFSLGSEGVTWTALGKKVALPLLLSPIVAAGIALLLPQSVFEFAGRFVDRCVCLYRGETVPAAVAPATPPELVVLTGDAASCPPGSAVRLGLNSVHLTTAALVNLARAVNDAPKIAALGAIALAATGELSWTLWMLVAVAMTAGSLLGGLRVTKTMGEKITAIDPARGATVNAITATLVSLASPLGLPLSTTHVANGAIVGGGLRRGWRAVEWKIVGQMTLAWLVTLPCAGGLAVASYALIRWIGG